jgi:hypothetical protein
MFIGALNKNKIISNLQRFKILNQMITQDKGLSFFPFGKFIFIGLEFLVSIVGHVKIRHHMKYLNSQRNQRTAGSDYFRNVKEPPGIMEEPRKRKRLFRAFCSAFSKKFRTVLI